ncbi:MAG: AAA family ATPase [Fimbriimonadaceae bacterium]|nr:AAA family ATPase [Fimbriimonadaceae bacterium]
MKLVSLVMTNFMPFRGEVSLAFPQDPTRNVMLVFGDNMRGKTSILNAFRWAFYGKAYGRHLLEIPLHEIINKEAVEDGSSVVEVGVEFSAEGHQYEIRRRAVKRAIVARPMRAEDFEPTTIALKKDGSVVAGHLVEAEINRFVPEQVSRFFLFDGELLQEYETLLIEGSDQGRQIKEAIEQVLGVPTLINGRNDASLLLKQFRRQQTRDLAHVEGLEKQAERQGELQSRQEALEKDIGDLKESLQRTRTSRTTLEDEFEAVASIHKDKSRLDSLNGQSKAIQAELQELATRRRELLRDAWRDLVRPRLAARKSALRVQQESLISQSNRRQQLVARREDLRRITASGMCPFCGREAEAPQREVSQRELDRLEADLASLAGDHGSISEVTSQIREIDRILTDGVSDLLRELDSRARKLDVKLVTIEDEGARLRENIRGFDTVEIARKRVQCDMFLQEEGRLQRDLDAQMAEMEKVKKEMAAVSRSIQHLPKARESRSTAIVNVCVALERVFSTSIERLRDSLREEVEAKASYAFRQLTTQRAYSGLQINQNYGLSIVDNSGARVTVRSAGAEQIVALSLIDGLARTGRSSGPVVMDTPFGRLDIKHRGNILRYLPATAGQLILLVHDGEIRKETDLEPVAARVGAEYEIVEVSSRNSQIRKVAK